MQSHAARLDAFVAWLRASGRETDAANVKRSVMLGFLALAKDRPLCAEHVAAGTAMARQVGIEDPDAARLGGMLVEFETTMSSSAPAVAAAAAEPIERSASVAVGSAARDRARARIGSDSIRPTSHEVGLGPAGRVAIGTRESDPVNAVALHDGARIGGASHAAAIDAAMRDALRDASTSTVTGADGTDAATSTSTSTTSATTTSTSSTDGTADTTTSTTSTSATRASSTAGADTTTSATSTSTSTSSSTTTSTSSTATTTSDTGSTIDVVAAEAAFDDGLPKLRLRAPARKPAAPAPIADPGRSSILSRVIGGVVLVAIAGGVFWITRPAPRPVPAIERIAALDLPIELPHGWTLVDRPASGAAKIATVANDRGAQGFVAVGGFVTTKSLVDAATNAERGAREMLGVGAYRSDGCVELDDTTARCRTTSSASRVTTYVRGGAERAALIVFVTRDASFDDELDAIVATAHP